VHILGKCCIINTVATGENCSVKLGQISTPAICRCIRLLRMADGGWQQPDSTQPLTKVSAGVSLGARARLLWWWQRKCSAYGNIQTSLSWCPLVCQSLQPMTATGSNKTLGDIHGAYRMHFNCTNSPACYFNKPMDVEALIKNLGEGFLTSDLYKVLKCPQCKGRKFLFMLTPVHFSYGDVPRENVTPQSHYSQAKRGILTVNTQ